MRASVIGTAAAWMLVGMFTGAVLAQEGQLPLAADGRTLNLDFEKGTLEDWEAEGEAFTDQPIEGDTVRRRRSDMRSRHQGKFWIGTFERKGDEPTGTLTSIPFRVTAPFASFLVGGGSDRSTRVELVLAEDGKVITTATGTNEEDMARVVVDLSAHRDRMIRIRLVDGSSGGWGHINFDDFRFHDAKPTFQGRAPLPPPDEYAHAGLDPQAAAEAMTTLPGFSVQLAAAEPDVTQPVAQAIDDRGRLWVVEAHCYPKRRPEGEGIDRILIFEDRDLDGVYETRKVFADKLNLVSGIELGHGGVFVGAAPYLMFIPDRDGDDRPDGPPEILLDGWGLEDTHETLNSFKWGPDGWLYGCHGVFTHSRVGKPGTPDAERIPINAGIWRYHPTRRDFEVFAHGTSNPWGVDFDDQGQCFLTCCVIPHLFHVIEGARYHRQAGRHFNPFTYADIRTIARHRHWVGAIPHAGNDRSDSAGGGHAHCGAMIYLGGSWPEEYRSRILMNNIHGARLNMDTLEPHRSGYIGDRAPDFLLANDRWSQIIALDYGPDGQMIMIDWYDANQCHRTEPSVHDRSNGRIFRVSYDGAKPVRVDLTKKSDLELVELQLEKNDWYVSHARRLLAERTAAGTLDPAARARLQELASTHPAEDRRLRGLWALHVTGGVPEEVLNKTLRDASPYVRGWSIQVALDGRQPTSDEISTMEELAQTDPSPVVRLYLASAVPRLPEPSRWTIVERLSRHREDADDHNLPLMVWYALEPLAGQDRARALKLAAAAAYPPLLEFTVRRVLAEPDDAALADVARILRDAPATAALPLLEGLTEALKGRRRMAMPEDWSAIYATLARHETAKVRQLANRLAVTFGDSGAVETLRGIARDPSARAELRSEAIESLAQTRDELLGTLALELLDDNGLRASAIRVLAAQEVPGAAERLVELYPSLGADEKRAVLSALASRLAYANVLVQAIGSDQIPAREVSADIIRQLRGLSEGTDLAERIAAVWGVIQDTPADRAKLIAEYKERLASIEDGTADPLAERMLGRAVYAKTCQQCHKLFDTGGNIGPELTGSNRAELDYVLHNILDPSALIGKDYLAQKILLEDGRVLIGLIREETADSLTVATAQETLVLPKDEIEAMQTSELSMMPDDLLKPLSDAEVRGLVAYLASPNQVPMLATPDLANQLFNGKDLTGWTGDKAFWSVNEAGEIVGRNDKVLLTNQFLRSHLAVEDFRLTLEVLLVDNKGNSGIQFRSEELPGGDVKGYQADIGKGWWGKLYEEHGRGILDKADGDALIEPGQWTRYEIVAEGSRIRTFLNGKPSVDIDDPTGARRGILALQLHSGPPSEVRFRNLKLEVLEAKP